MVFADFVNCVWALHAVVVVATASVIALAAIAVLISFEGGAPSGLVRLHEAGRPQGEALLRGFGDAGQPTEVVATMSSVPHRNADEKEIRKGELKWMRRALT